MPKAQAIPRPWSRPATQLAEIMAKVALELEARSDQGPSGDLNRNSIQEACRAQRDATAWLGRWRLLTACWRGANLKWPTETRLHGCVRSAMRTGLGQPAPLLVPVMYIFSATKIPLGGARFEFIGVFRDNFQRK